MPKERSAYLQVLEVDNALPISPQALELWLKDIDRPTRWFLRPILQFLFAIQLHITWFFKRLPLPQFRAHKFLQWTICWFCKWFVTPEASLLILRHFATESNILNFLHANTGRPDITPLNLYPQCIDDMLEFTFVDHDQELFRILRELNPVEYSSDAGSLSWENWQPITVAEGAVVRKITQIIDFETAHALFMCLFCLLLTQEEYRDAINGFQLDHSIAIHIGKIVGDPNLTDLVYNKYPHYLVGPWNLGQRFLMHGFFTEYLHERLERLRVSADSLG